MRLDRLVARHRRPARSTDRWSEADAWLIAYPDHFGPGGLAAVEVVMNELAPALNGVHLLPFHPSSSDGGFSVEDHALVDPAVGSWRDVERLGRRHRLMADAVINHVSAQGTWFREHLAGAPERADFFRTVMPGVDLSAIARPRSGPPTTAFPRADGSTADYWTTFGPDQVDLDFRSPEVLLAVVEAVLRYLDHGAAAVRLDAVAYLWKDPSTSSMHLAQTHDIVALLRDCVAEVDPGVVLVTETNVPHAENLSYLGSAAAPEAHAVYQFSLAPLVLHAIQTGDAAPLRAWARQLEPVAGTTTLNFLASHDGVGLRPAKGWLLPSQVEDLAARCRAVGGEVNEASIPGGTEPYELAASWMSLCRAGVGGPYAEGMCGTRLLATHSIALALQGVPLIYANSIVGAPNATDRAARSGIARDLNRGRFDSAADYLDRASTSDIWSGLRHMLEWRRRRAAFHPDAPQRVWDNEGPLVVVERGEAEGSGALVITNVGAQSGSVDIGTGWVALNDGRATPAVQVLGPWETRWLERADGHPAVALSPR